MKKEILRRTTKQRSIILEELRKVKTHPTADIIFMMVRKKIPSISFGTVYRNLNLLRDEGQILELACGKYRCRYDGTVKTHYHSICLECEKVFDLEEPLLKNLDTKISKKSNFEIKYHRIDFYGYCQDCKKSAKMG